MQSPKTILLFFLKAVGVYFALMLPIPGLMSGYHAVVRGMANVAFGSLGDGGSASFESLKGDEYEKDTRIVLRNERVPSAEAPLETRLSYAAWRPTAFLIALIVASPVPWRRRGLSLIVGVGLVQVFVLVRLWVRIAVVLSAAQVGGRENVLRAYDFARDTQGLLGVLGKLDMSPAVSYIVPAIVWVLVTFRREDWARLGMMLEQPADSDAQSSGGTSGESERAPNGRTDSGARKRGRRE